MTTSKPSLPLEQFQTSWWDGMKPGICFRITGGGGGSDRAEASQAWSWMECCWNWMRAALDSTLIDWEFSILPSLSQTMAALTKSKESHPGPALWKSLLQWELPAELCSHGNLWTEQQAGGAGKSPSRHPSLTGAGGNKGRMLIIMLLRNSYFTGLKSKFMLKYRIGDSSPGHPHLMMNHAFSTACTGKEFAPNQALLQQPQST